MASIIKVNTIQDAGSNTIISSDGSGTFTPSSSLATGVLSNTPAFQAYLSSDQSLSDNVSAKIQFDTEDFDTDGCYDNTTNYRFTPTTAGKYFVYTTVRVDAGANSDNIYCQAFIQKNGATVYTSIIDFRNNNGRQATLSLSAIIDMNGTSDYLEVSGLVNDGGTGGIVESNAGSAFFGAYKLIGA